MALNQHTAMDPKVIGFTGYPLSPSGKWNFFGLYNYFIMFVSCKLNRISLLDRYFSIEYYEISKNYFVTTTSSSSSPSLTNGGGTSSSSAPNGDSTSTQNSSDGLSMLSLATSIGRNYFRSKKSLLNSQYTNSKQVNGMFSLCCRIVLFFI